MLFSRFTNIQFDTESCWLLAHIRACPVRLVSIEDPYHLPFTVFVEESFLDTQEMPSFSLILAERLEGIAYICSEGIECTSLSVKI